MPGIASAPAIRSAPDDRARPLRDRFAGALLGFDVTETEAVIRDALRDGLSRSEICAAVIEPVMVHVGELWHAGEISVGDEHVATGLAFRALEVVAEDMRVPAPHTRERVLLAGVDDERHTLGLQMVDAVLHGAGYDTLYLGPGVPVEDLLEAIARHRPRAVGLSATLPRNGVRLRRVLRRIRAEAPGVTLMAGGQGVPASLRRDPSVLTVGDVRDLLAALEAALDRA